MDLFIAPTINFDLLYAFVIVRLDRRELSTVSALGCHSAHSRSHCSLLCLDRPSPSVDGEPF
jgi:hypothetical protein